MGVDQTFHYGPYVECKAQGKPDTRIINFCSTDEKHIIRYSDSFCSKCGAAINSRTVFLDDLKADIAWEALDKELDDRLMHVLSEDKGLRAYYASNITNDGIGRKTSLGKYEEEICEIVSGQPLREIFLFTEFFKKEIEVLRKYYKQVRVCWGIFKLGNHGPTQII